MILSTGTFLKGLVHVGLVNYPAGRAGDFAACAFRTPCGGWGFPWGGSRPGRPPAWTARPSISRGRPGRTGTSARCLSPSIPRRYAAAAAVLADVHQRGHARGDPSGLSRSPPTPASSGGSDPGTAPRRGQGRPFPGEGEASAVPRARGLADRRVLPNGISTSLLTTSRCGWCAPFRGWRRRRSCARGTRSSTISSTRSSFTPPWRRRS